MSIVEKKKGELASKDSIAIITIPRIVDKVNEMEYIKGEFERLKDVNDKNIKLALKLKEVRDKYDECKHQNYETIKTMIEYKKIVDKLNFKFMCPELKKEITLFNCVDACYNKICKGLYHCEDRIKAIKENYRIS